LDATAEGATLWGRDAVEEVAGDAIVEGAVAWRLGFEQRRPREVESGRRCDAMSVEPLWWRRGGICFIRGAGEDAMVPVEQVKMALWEWSSRDR
jgi:hypothetical protein